MKVSLNTIRWQGYSDAVALPLDELVAKIGAQIGAVEEVVDLGARYDSIWVAKVVSVADHPNADKLHICLIDDGQKTPGVTRDEKGLIQVVCGAPNVREGILVAWLPPGATVPESIGNEPFVLGARELRGVMSNGMLASAKELAIGDSHEGLLEIDPALEIWTPNGNKNPSPGLEFKKLYGLEDEIIDIENKMFTHRPDCFGMLGVAREIAGVQGLSFKSPAWYLKAPIIAGGSELSLSVKNELPKLVPRFMALALGGITVKPSPIWLQSFLSRVGVKPINNVVDITNYMMLLTGQPLHAYDYDKVAARSENGAEIIVRHPADGEKIRLLNGKDLSPRAEAIMISASKELIGVGGVMGGADTEVDNDTKNIILECATFDMYSIRRTAMAHGLFTEAVTRYNKGQSPLQNDKVFAEAVKMLQELAGARPASKIIDQTSNLPELTKVTTSAQFINDRLGLSLGASEIAKILTNVEFTCTVKEEKLEIVVPFWRTDIEIAEDIVEEVGRLVGFDTLPLALPKQEIKPSSKNKVLSMQAAVRQSLAKNGANEVLTYSFVHGDLLNKAGQKPEDSYKLTNAISPELQYYRQSITPSLLDKVYGNIRAGYDEFALFEIGKTHNKIHGNGEDNLPGEIEMFALVFAANAEAAKNYEGSAFYYARAYLDALAGNLNIELEYKAISEDPGYPVTQAFDHKRSAYVSTADGTFLGIVGEYKTNVLKNFKLPAFCAGFELGTLDVLKAAGQAVNRYQPISKYPKVSQDISLKLEKKIALGDLLSFLQSELNAKKPENTQARLAPIDIYQKDSDTHMAFRLTIASFERTLSAEEVNILLDSLAAAAKTSFAASRI